MKFRLTHHINLPVSDIAAAERFYGTVLGLPQAPRSDEYIEFTDGTLHFYLDPDESTPGPIFEFAVEDLEAAREELVAAGCTVLRWDGPGKQNYMRDPNGYCFNLWEEEKKD